MRAVIFFIFFSASLMFSVPAYSKSEYVLPYPSSMPGSKFYKIHLIWEEVMKYWYFGNFGQFKYSLSEADKYLVEAKNLFEYKQYLLASQALKKSNSYFINSFRCLNEAKKNGKNIDQKLITFKNASLKHIEVLDLIMKNTPVEFLWQPEKESSKRLKLWENIGQSIKVREHYL